MERYATSDIDEFAEHITPFKLWTVSTWPNNTAIHDSKKEIYKEIRHRWAQEAPSFVDKLKAPSEAAPLRGRQAASIS